MCVCFLLNQCALTAMEGGCAAELGQKPISLKCGDFTLAGFLNSNGDAEWDQARVLDNLGMQGSKDFVFLKRNKGSFDQELEDAEVPENEVHFRGASSNQRHMGHTYESRALLLLLCLVPSKRSSKQASKEAAMRFLQKILQTVVVELGPAGGSLALTVWSNGQPHQGDVAFSQLGISAGFGGLLEKLKQAAGQWQSMSRSQWCGCQISSALEQATLWDHAFPVLGQSTPCSEEYLGHGGEALVPQAFAVCWAVPREGSLQVQRFAFAATAAACHQTWQHKEGAIG